MKITDKEAARLHEITMRERALYEEGYENIAGMDEVGRGPLAGPVTVACVIMPKGPLIAHVKDSKKLSEKRREALYEQIIQAAISWRVVSVDAPTIDEINILQATRRAMQQAACLDIVPDYYLVDAMQGLRLPAPAEAIIHGDALSYSIAAASIVAKVTRDRMMIEADSLYPAYGFAKNKGYGTATHMQALEQHGSCPLHRRSFIKRFL